MTGKLVTVVLPTYGRPRRLRDCLEALAGQSLREPWDVVVVDDGSPEPLAGLPQAFAGRLELRVIRQENAGPSAARNRGVAATDAQLVAFTDDDCVPETGWLATLVEAARELPGSLIGGTTLNGLPHDLFASASQSIIDLVYEHFNAEADAATFLTSNNVLCPRYRFIELGGFDTAFPRAGAEDRDFCDRWRLAGWPIVWRPAARVEHRHSQTLGQFLEVNFRYGRGAYRFHRLRGERGSGAMAEHVGFHATIPSRLARLLRRQKGVLRKVGILAALMAWEASNAAGYGYEMLVTINQRGDRHGPGKKRR